MDQGINRRGFLKLSAAGSAVLATGSGLALLTGCSSNDGPATGYKHFRQQDVDLLTPLVGAVLGSALSDAGATAEDGMKAYDDLLDGGICDDDDDDSEASKLHGWSWRVAAQTPHKL